MWSISKRLESLWRQKSRATGVKLGDHNTRFFQLPATNRGRRNFVGRISSNGGLITDPTELKAEAVNFFSGLSSTENWSKTEYWRTRFQKAQQSLGWFLGEESVFIWNEASCTELWLFESSRTLWLYLHIPQTGLEFFHWRLFSLGFEIFQKENFAKKNQWCLY